MTKWMNFQSKNCLCQQKLSGSERGRSAWKERRQLGWNHPRESQDETIQSMLDHLLLSAWQCFSSSVFKAWTSRVYCDSFDACHFPLGKFMNFIFKIIQLVYQKCNQYTLPEEKNSSICFLAPGILMAVASYCTHCLTNKQTNCDSDT